jgi:Tat protein secretion system quality control protein TatD with DNase activity
MAEFGVHPWEMDRWTRRELMRLREYLQERQEN